MRVASLVALLAVALLVAGCFGKGGTPAAYTVHATGGKVSPGWAYDGAGLVDGAATLDGHVVNADNSGALFANFSYAGSQWQVLFTKFSQAAGKDFQDGGIAFGLTEHGDSGVADNSIPKIHGKLVAYGTATVMRDGKPVIGKTGLADWAAHLMVYDDAVRGPDGKITNAAGSAPYDPSKPADAKTYPGQAQAMLKLVSPDGDSSARPPVHVDKNLTIQGPNGDATADIPVEAGALPFSIFVNSTPVGTPAPTEAPLQVGQINVAVKVGDKTLTDSANITPNGGYAKKFDLAAADLSNVTKPIQVEVTGSGAYGVEVVADVAYDDHPFMVVTWENPTLS
jgi:hypothetical protein